MKKIKAVLQQHWKVGVALIGALFVGAWLQIVVFDGWLRLWSLVAGYQTLLAGLAAVGAAFISIRVVWIQITDQRNLNDELQYKKTLATRAVLPNALAELCGFTESWAVRWISYPEGHIPEQSDEAIRVIEEAIEHVDRKSANRLYDLLVCYQVHNAFAYSDSNLIPEVGLSNVADLRFVIDSLFAYAYRQQDVAVRPMYTAEAAFKALRECLNNRSETNFPAYAEAIVQIGKAHAEAAGREVHPLGLDPRTADTILKDVLATVL